MFRSLGNGREQRRGVGMLRGEPRGQDLLCRSVLEDRAAVHHGDAVRQPGDDADVVADQHGRDAQFGLELGEKVHDLRLDRGIQPGGRFVGDQKRRFAGKRHGDHGPLAHAARKAVGIVVEPEPRGVDLHPVEPGERLLLALLLVRDARYGARSPR